MHRAWITALTLAAGVSLVGCGESRDSFPTSPQFRPAPSGFVCDFSLAASLARSYFDQPTQNVVVDLINQMQAATDPTRTARGLDVFEKVAAGTDVTGTTLVGSNLLNAIGACSRLGQKAAIDYTAALGSQGAFAVRGPTSDPVRSKDDFSGVAPPTGKSWSEWLGLPASNTDPAKDLPDGRAAVYGAPFGLTSDLSPETVAGARGFDWSTLPVAPNFPLNGDGFLALCVGSSNPADRIQNNHIQGTTTFKGVLGLAGNSPFALNCIPFDDNGVPLASGLLRRMIDVFAPEPLFAAALTKRTIGTPGGFSKNFVVVPTAVTLTFGPVSDGFVGVTMKPLQVTAATGGGVAMQNIGITIEATTNNGVPARLSVTTPLITDEFGKVTFDDLVLNSAGGYQWHVTTTSGTGGIADGERTSTTFHIKNKK